MSDSPISHAFVLPDDGQFFQWYNALKPYLAQFDNVAVIRGSGGNDLTPYRNVSVINVPNMWLRDDPVFHIRRIFPTIVMVDVVQATTPAQLQSMMQTRINLADRYGRQRNDGHINERFVIGWATDRRPYESVRPFTKQPTGTASDILGIEIATTGGSNILAAVGGKVTKQWSGNEPDALRLGNYIQITTQHNGTTYILTYAGLSAISVPLHTTVTKGDVIGKVSGSTCLVVVQSPTAGTDGYRLPNIVNPYPLLYVDSLRVRPTGSGLWVRKLPRLESDTLGQLQPYDFVLPREMHADVIAKTGVEGEWINVRMPDGRNGFAAAWFLEATEFKRFALEINPVGVNLDARHPLGTPDASRLGNIGWVRFGYNVSNNSGSEDINAAYNRYAPLTERYVNAGYKVCFTTSHQTYGEAKGFPPWPQMRDDNWRVLIDRFADMMRRISQQWAGKGLVHCWQVWNEQDAPVGAIASVPMSPQNYGLMLDKCIPAIKSTDSDVLVVTGGHTSGPVSGPNYIRAALQQTAQRSRLDGVAFHPYGRALTAGSHYGQFGHIDESIRGYSNVLPTKPLWITEWGVLDRPEDSPTDIANYAINMINHLKARYPGQIAALIWYAWAQSMHNGYGIVDSNSQPRSPLTERFLQA
ncbi:MAG: M23 family metallopeptidase [Chloroflexota bacterium]